jgi:hypothetical protein
MHDRTLSRLGYLWYLPRLPPSPSAVMAGLLTGLGSGFAARASKSGRGTSGT